MHCLVLVKLSLRWRHNELDGVSDHQPHDCLLGRLFGHRSKKSSKLRVTGLCAGNSPGTGEFPAQKASNAENTSIWWRHHDGFLPRRWNYMAVETFIDKWWNDRSHSNVFHYFSRDHIRINCLGISHDDVIKWKHFPRYWPFVRRIHRSPVNSPQKGQWRGALMFSLICVWINDWVNNGEAGDLRGYRIHYDVTVMLNFLRIGLLLSEYLICWSISVKIEWQTSWYKSSKCTWCVWVFSIFVIGSDTTQSKWEEDIKLIGIFFQSVTLLGIRFKIDIFNR